LGYFKSGVSHNVPAVGELSAGAIFAHLDLLISKKRDSLKLGRRRMPEPLTALLDDVSCSQSQTQIY